MKRLVRFNIGEGASEPVARGRIVIRRAQRGIDGDLVVAESPKVYELTGAPHLELELEVGTTYLFNEDLRDGGGVDRFCTVPEAGDGEGPVDYSALPDVVPVPPEYAGVLTDAVTGAHVDGERIVLTHIDGRTTDGGPIDDQQAINAHALRHFHSVAADPTAPTNLVVIGDSITEGFGASSWQQRWTNVLARELRKTFQPEGVVGGAGYFNGWNQSGFPDWPVDPVTPIINTDYGLGRQALVMDAAGNSAIFDTTPICTGFDIIAAKTDSGTGSPQLQYVVDGGATQVVNLSDAPVARGGYRVAEIRGLARSGHSIIIASAAGDVTFEGLMFYDGDETSGIRVWESGRSGATTAEYVAPHTRWMDSLIDIQPALVVLALGSNDYETGRTPAQFETDMATLTAAITSTLGYRPSLALVAYYGRSAAGWDDYRTAYRRLSATHDLALVDLSHQFGPWEADDRGGLMAPDLHHPSDAGHAVIGRRVARALT